MKLLKTITICLSFGFIALVSCNSGENQNNSKNDKQELFAEAKKDNLFNFGKTTGYEISGTTVINGSATHYKAAMKGNIVYLNYVEKSGGGWNYMAFKLSDDGKKCTSCTYLEDLSIFGEPQERGSDAFKSGFNTSVTPFYEASQPAICNNSKYVGNEMIAGINTFKFEYIDSSAAVTQKITSYVEEEFGLTVKIVTEYLKGEEVTYSKEMSITSIKQGNDVAVPNFSFEA